MKKTIHIFAYMFILSLSIGCTMNSIEQTDAISKEEVPATELETENKENVNQSEKVDENNNRYEESSEAEDSLYYKLKINQGDLDNEQIVRYILGESAFNQVRGDIVSEQDTPYEGIRNSVTLDGVTHSWMDTTRGFWYLNDMEPGQPDHDNARALADSFAGCLNGDFCEEVKEETRWDGSFLFTYFFRYEGVRLMGENGLYFTQDEEEIALTGPYVRVGVGEYGILSVDVSAMPDIEGVSETYRKEDFMTEERIISLSRQYVLSSIERFGNSLIGELLIQDPVIIYMPFRDSQDDVYLIPVYEVIAISEEEDVEKTRTLLIDACNGYIYDMDIYFDIDSVME